MIVVLVEGGILVTGAEVGSDPAQVVAVESSLLFKTDEEGEEQESGTETGSGEVTKIWLVSVILFLR